MKTLYSMDYSGLFKITYANGFYEFRIGLPSYMTGTNVTLETDSEEEFVKYLKEEIRTRNYARQLYYKVIRTYETREE